MRGYIAAILFCAWAAPGWAADPLHSWQFSVQNVRERVITPRAGDLDAVIVGPFKFSDDKPRTLVLPGDSKQRNHIRVTADLARAGLPTAAVSVEAWVKIDKTAKWHGIIGAFQDNGNYERGWLLGSSGQHFVFALASAQAKRLTYLKARTSFQPGHWYHVVGTYDGQQLCIYVDGRLEARSDEQSGPIAYPATGHYTIGAYHDDNDFVSLQGQIEQVSVFGHAFAARAVSERFQQRRRVFPDLVPIHPTVTDWPTYQRDNLRTGIAPRALKLPLHLQWAHRARHAPAPAWPEEALHDYWHNKYNMPDRVIYDRAFHLVSVGDCVYFGSSADDKVYCLDAAGGQERWSYFTEGPVRLAPTLTGDRLLVGSDDGFVYCLDARDGALIWKQRIGPSGRRIAGNGRVIGAWPVRTNVLVEEGKAYVCAGVFPSQGVYQATLDVNSGKLLERTELDVTAQGYLGRVAGKLCVSTGRDPAGAFVARLKRRGKDIGTELNALPAEYPHAFVGAGQVRFGGGDSKIAAFAVDDGKKLWSAKVEGRVHSLAVAGGRLLASTDKGVVYCFAPAALESTSKAEVEPAVGEAKPEASSLGKLADRIVAQSGRRRGYCLIVGSGDGKLALALARRSELQVIGIEPDEARLDEARRLIDAAGLQGRVAFHQGPLEPLPYTDYLFNIVVAGSLARGERWPGERPEMLRVLRPAGGVALFGLDDSDITRRPALKGAGEWSHMYADAGNTACSRDERIGSQFLLQWFGKPGPRGMIDRHHRTVAPLYKNGLLFVPAEDRVIAVDAYNGIILWEREIKGSRRVIGFRDCSHLAAGDERLYVAGPDACVALDATSGTEKARFNLPDLDEDTAYEWGYLASIGDVLVGSAVKPGSTRRKQSHLIDRTETYYDRVPIVGSDFLFARDGKDGKLLWSYRPESGLILNPTIACAEGRIVFIESTNPATLKKKINRANLAEMLGKGAKLTALDLRTGKVLWSKPAELAKLEHSVYVSATLGKIVVAGSRNSGPSKKTDTVFYDLHVFDAATGDRKWFKSHNTNQRIGGDHGEQDQHPVIVGTKLYCEPFAYDLHSGATIDWKWPWRGRKRAGCGNLSASASTFFFRDNTLSMFDLTSNQAKKVTRTTRPGCWINLIPAGGLLLAPEASSGCSCDRFSVQTSLGLLPVKSDKEKP